MYKRDFIDSRKLKKVQKTIGECFLFVFDYKMQVNINTHKNVKEMVKGMSFCHKLYFSNLDIFETQCRRPLIFQTMNSIRPRNLSLKYQRFIPSDCKGKGNRQFEFVTKTQIL